MSSVRMSGAGPLPPGRALKIILEEAHQGMTEAVVHTEGVWRSRLVPNVRGYRTGTYSRSITHTVSPKGSDPVLGQVGTNVFYAKFLEEGTGLYGPRHRWITPKKPGGALRFPASVGPGTAFTLAGRRRSGRAGAMARYVYAKRVRGIVPRRYARDAAFISRPRVEQFFAAAAFRAAERLRGIR